MQVHASNSQFAYDFKLSSVHGGFQEQKQSTHSLVKTTLYIISVIILLAKPKTCAGEVAILMFFKSFMANWVKFVMHVMF